MTMSVTSAGAGQMARAMSGASARMSPDQKFSNLFDQIDTSGSGAISKDQFSQAFSSLKMPPSFRKQGADAVFSQLDSDGDGSVSKDEFVSGMKQQMQAARAARHQQTQAATASTAPTAQLSTDFQAMLKDLGALLSGGGTSASSGASGAALGTKLDVSV